MVEPGEKREDLESFDDLTLEESTILERLEDADDMLKHCHHALVHNPFAWSE